MEFGIEILSAAALFGVLGFATSVFCYRKQRYYPERLELAEQRIEDLEESLTRIKDSSEINSQRLSEQSRRIAWLETRIRQPKLLKDDLLREDLSLEDSSIHDTPKLNMTEKRHRVIKLASRGQNSETIAAALGMLAGEVELIMSLSQAGRA